MKTAEAVELIRKARRSGSAEEIDARVELILLDHAKLYSDQQNKELRESRPFQFSPTNSEREWQVKIVNDYIHPNQEDWQKMNAVCNSLIEIQRITKELKQAEDILEQQIKGAIAWQEGAEKLESEVERLTKELELCQTGNSDLQMEVDELKETKALRDAYANKIERQNLRIEILKKDVVTLDSELTRLRELLEKSKKYVLEKDFVLASEIDNALNHKPMTEETQFMKSILPRSYSCTPLENGVNCKSITGIDERDNEHWDYIMLAIRQKFGSRFMEVYHNTCYNHVNFNVYIHPKSTTN